MLLKQEAKRKKVIAKFQFSGLVEERDELLAIVSFRKKFLQCANHILRVVCRGPLWLSARRAQSRCGLLTWWNSHFHCLLKVSQSLQPAIWEEASLPRTEIFRCASDRIGVDDLHSDIAHQIIHFLFRFVFAG
jgi:hypothetical protein